MKILSLDLGLIMGWAWGETGARPESGSVRLSEGALGAGEQGVWLRDHRREHGLPDLIIIEKYMNPAGQRNVAPIISGLRFNGAVHAIAGVYGVKVAEVQASTIRKAVCGRASAAGDVSPLIPKSRLREAQRKATKAMVVRTMILRGIIPAGCIDDNRADAACGWVYAEAVYGRRAPAQFILT